MAYSATWLMSAEATAGRKVRMNSYPCAECKIERLAYVVWVEVRPYEHEELDAGDFAHAMNIAMAWVDNGMAMTASIRKVRADGSLPRNTETIVAPQCETEWE